MSPLPIQFGELAGRLRRAVELVGRIPLALDETVVPTVILRDAGELPFALDPNEIGGFKNLSPTAGQQATLGITNNGPKGSVFVLDLLWLASQTAGNRIEVSRSGVLQSDGVSSDTLAADLSTTCKGLTTALQAQVLLRAWTTAPAATGGAISHEFRVLTTHQPFEVRMALRSGEVAYVKCQTVSQDIYVAFRGRFYSRAAFDAQS